MYTLFGTKGSGSAAIEVALDWCGVPHKSIRAATWEADSALEELAKFNPLKQIPTLLFGDGSAMSESAAILIELGLRFPKSELLPSQSLARAKTIRGLVFIAANCYSAVSVSDYPERWIEAPDEASSLRVRKAARVQLHRSWDIFADLFAVDVNTSFLMGESPCALDILAAVVSKWSGTRKHLEKTRPRFLECLHRIEAHPKIAPTFARHWPAN
jgi:GST-like protein